MLTRIVFKVFRLKRFETHPWLGKACLLIVNSIELKCLNYLENEYVKLMRTTYGVDDADYGIYLQCLTFTRETKYTLMNFMDHYMNN
jgi:hypothetical protein